jgi:hypothetical protein
LSIMASTTALAKSSSTMASTTASASSLTVASSRKSSSPLTATSITTSVSPLTVSRESSSSLTVASPMRRRVVRRPRFGSYSVGNVTVF